MASSSDPTSSNEATGFSTPRNYAQTDLDLPKVTGNGERATVLLSDYILAIRQGDRLLAEERDRRYAEVNVEKEKALKIKETADLAALQLAREIQTYKDEKANELREQINSERGLYSTKGDLQNVSDRLESLIKPLAEWITTQQGRGVGSEASEAQQRAAFNQRIVVLGVVISAIVIIVNIIPIFIH